MFRAIVSADIFESFMDPIQALVDEADSLGRDAVDASSAAPEWVIRIRTGVIPPPLLQPRHTRYEEQGSLAPLTLERDLKSVLVVGETTQLEIVQFARSRTKIPRDGDERSVTQVVAGIDHRADVFVPPEHVGGIRRGVVVAGIITGHPAKALWDSVDFARNNDGGVARAMTDLETYEYTVKLSRGTKRDDRDTQKVKVRANSLDQLQTKVENVKEQLKSSASDYREIQPQQDRHLAEDQSELGEVPS